MLGEDFKSEWLILRSGSATGKYLELHIVRIFRLLRLKGG
jgi:hypothetical protein